MTPGPVWIIWDTFLTSSSLASVHLQCPVGHSDTVMASGPEGVDVCRAVIQPRRCHTLWACGWLSYLRPLSLEVITV